jgi:hypothetical protein
MQSKTDGFLAELEALKTEKKTRSFDLYEEYSQCDIEETIRRSRINYEKANVETRRQNETIVKNEVEAFRAWLEEIKHFKATEAYYYSISLKSLLLGLPIGVQVAKLFNEILERQDSNETHGLKQKC